MTTVEIQNVLGMDTSLAIFKAGHIQQILLRQTCILYNLSVIVLLNSIQMVAPTCQKVE